MGMCGFAMATSEMLGRGLFNVFLFAVQCANNICGQGRASFLFTP